MDWPFGIVVIAFIVVAGVWLLFAKWRDSRNSKRDEWIPRAELVTGDMNAPWEEFPDYSCVSIGWRMGVGEGYFEKWHRWYECMSVEERSVYRAQHRQPSDWFDFYDRLEAGLKAKYSHHAAQ